MAIYKLKNGKYLVRVNTKLTTGVYKRLNKTVNSYSEAKKVERVLIGKARQDDKTNFGLLLDNYIEDEEKREKVTTLYVVKQKIEIHIRPFFQNYRICDITPELIHQWQLIEFQKNLSETYLFNIECLLFKIFKYAVAFYQLKNNPCKHITHLGNNSIRKEINFWNIDEKFYEHRYFLLLLISFLCGTRIGETLALTREDIDYEQCAIRINKTFVRLNKKEYIQEPKTPSSIRVISIPAFLKEQIDIYVQRLPDTQLRLFAGLTREIANYKLHQLAKRAGVKPIRFHDLRHSAVSYWLHLGIPIYDISKRCGHTTPRVTYRVYSHMYPSDEKAPDILEKAAKGENLT